MAVTTIYVCVNMKFSLSLAQFHKVSVSVNKL